MWTRGDIDFIKIAILFIVTMLFTICAFLISLSIDVSHLKG